MMTGSTVAIFLDPMDRRQQRNSFSSFLESLTRQNKQTGFWTKLKCETLVCMDFLDCRRASTFCEVEISHRESWAIHHGTQNFWDDTL